MFEHQALERAVLIDRQGDGFYMARQTHKCVKKQYWHYSRPFTYHSTCTPEGLRGYQSGVIVERGGQPIYDRDCSSEFDFQACRKQGNSEAECTAQVVGNGPTEDQDDESPSMGDWSD